jgi:Dienelactone hydrolase family
MLEADCWSTWLTGAVGEWKEILVKDAPPAAAYLARPRSGAGTGVLLRAAYWGVTAHVRRLCRDLAIAGFTALAPNLYANRTTTYDSQVAERLISALEEDRVEAIPGAATDFLLDQPGTNGGKARRNWLQPRGWAITPFSTIRPELRAPSRAATGSRRHRITPGSEPMLTSSIWPTSTTSRRSWSGHALRLSKWQALQ